MTNETNEQTLTEPPYKLITSTLGLDMNSKQRRQAKRRTKFLAKMRAYSRKTEEQEIDHQAANAQRIEPDTDLEPEMTTPKAMTLILAALLGAILLGVINFWGSVS